MKVAIVTEWLVTYAGAERVLKEMLHLFPQADLFSVIDFIPPGQRDFLKGKAAKTTFIQRLPFAKTKYRAYLPLMPLAIEQLDVTSYDLVLSNHHAVAKGVLTSPDQVHICFCNSPMRYAWDLQHQYLKESDLMRGPKSWMARWMLHKLRLWDHRCAAGVDHFVANSSYISRRIEKAYRRKADVIYSPVAVEDFPLCRKKEDFYLTASRIVPYKRMDLIVEAFAKMPEKRLVVIGEGPDYGKIQKKAAKNIVLMGHQPHEVLKDHMQRAKAFVFAAEEDFGIIPIEAQSCGTPVIAYGKGGSLETICEGTSGIFFYEQTPASIIDAVNRFGKALPFDPDTVRSQALRFSTERFRHEFYDYVMNKMNHRNT